MHFRYIVYFSWRRGTRKELDLFVLNKNREHTVWGYFRINAKVWTAFVYTFCHQPVQIVWPCSINKLQVKHMNQVTPTNIDTMYQCHSVLLYGLATILKHPWLSLSNLLHYVSFLMVRDWFYCAKHILGLLVCLFVLVICFLELFRKSSMWRYGV